MSNRPRPNIVFPSKFVISDPQHQKTSSFSMTPSTEYEMHRPERKAIRTMAQATQAQNIVKKTAATIASKTTTSCDVSLLSAYMASFSKDFLRVPTRDIEDVAKNCPPKHCPHYTDSTFSESQAILITIKRVHLETDHGIGVPTKRLMKRPHVGHLRPNQVCEQSS